jgi:hypothetical protein
LCPAASDEEPALSASVKNNKKAGKKGKTTKKGKKTKRAKETAPEVVVYVACHFLRVASRDGGNHH